MVNKKLEELRERLVRKKRAVRAKRRNEARSQTRGAAARERAERERRIKENRPEGLSETAQATAQQTRLLAAELGISTERARAVQQQAGDTLDRALEGGDEAFASLDLDGDGDTDLLDAFEQSLQSDSRGNPESFLEPGMGPVNDPIDPAKPVSGGSKKGEPDFTSKEFEDDLLGL